MITFSSVSSAMTCHWHRHQKNTWCISEDNIHVASSSSAGRLSIKLIDCASVRWWESSMYTLYIRDLNPPNCQHRYKHQQIFLSRTPHRKFKAEKGPPHEHPLAHVSSAHLNAKTLATTLKGSLRIRLRPVSVEYIAWCTDASRSMYVRMSGPITKTRIMCSFCT